MRGGRRVYTAAIEHSTLIRVQNVLTQTELCDGGVDAVAYNFNINNNNNNIGNVDHDIMITLTLWTGWRFKKKFANVDSSV